QPGETLYIRARYVSPSDQPGPWSPEVSAVAGHVDFSDIQFMAIREYAVVSHIETDVIQTTSRSYTPIDLATPALNLNVGDTVLFSANASVCTTASGRSADGTIRHERPDGPYYYTGLETRHTSANADATGQLVLIETYVAQASGRHRWTMEWRST